MLHLRRAVRITLSPIFKFRTFLIRTFLVVPRPWITALETYQQRSVFIHQVEKDDELAESSPEDGLGREANHGPLAAPECDVILEGQEVKEEVDG